MRKPKKINFKILGYVILQQVCYQRKKKIYHLTKTNAYSEDIYMSSAVVVNQKVNAIGREYTLES